MNSPGWNDDVRDAPHDRVEVRRLEILEEGVLAEESFEGLDRHGHLPCASPWRTARASALR